MAKEFDYSFGLTKTIIPSKQDEREGEYVGAFKKLVEGRIVPEILTLPQFPSKKEVVLSVMQFFLTEKEYTSRDIDNMSKTILDCLKGKFYLDDSQVRTLLISKKISPKVKSNFVFVGVRELKGETDTGIVQDHLLEQAITLYQISAKAGSK